MLDLYILETCPYCRKVMEFMAENNIQYRKFDVSDDDNTLRLLSIGGIDQVPFLYNPENGDKLYESDKIIEYLKQL